MLSYRKQHKEAGDVIWDTLKTNVTSFPRSPQIPDETSRNVIGNGQRHAGVNYYLDFENYFLQNIAQFYAYDFAITINHRI